LPRTRVLETSQTGGAMDKVKTALLVTVMLSVVSVIGDCFLKRASGREQPFAGGWFFLGLLVFCSTAFGWVFVMRHLKFASIGAVYSISTVLLLTFVGTVFLRERLAFEEMVGIGLAIASLVLLARFAG
jgi:small multidrug resistance pump